MIFNGKGNWCSEYPQTTLTGSGTNQFYAFNGMATLMCSGTTTDSQWGTVSLCTIPDGYRPTMGLYFPVQKDGAASQSDSYITITTAGVVTLQNAGGTQVQGNTYRATCSWVYQPTIT